MKKTALVIMAAGIGSRFGKGIKQLEPVGPNGEIDRDVALRRRRLDRHEPCGIYGCARFRSVVGAFDAMEVRSGKSIDDFDIPAGVVVDGIDGVSATDRIDIRHDASVMPYTTS